MGDVIFGCYVMRGVHYGIAPANADEFTKKVPIMSQKVAELRRLYQEGSYSDLLKMAARIRRLLAMTLRL